MNSDIRNAKPHNVPKYNQYILLIKKSKNHSFLNTKNILNKFSNFVFQNLENYIIKYLN